MLLPSVAAHPPGSPATPTRVHYCHGLESGPNGYKVRTLRAQNFVVTAPDMQMSLWNPLLANSITRCLFAQPITRWPAEWGLTSAMDDSFARCVDVQRAALAQQADSRADVLVGSSWGGAVAAALLAGGEWAGPAVLMCPALSKKESWKLSRGDAALSADDIAGRIAALPEATRSRCVLVHGTADDTVGIDDSRALSRRTGIDLVEIEGGSHGMGAMVTEGRLAQLIARATRR